MTQGETGGGTAIAIIGATVIDPGDGRDRVAGIHLADYLVGVVRDVDVARSIRGHAGGITDQGVARAAGNPIPGIARNAEAGHYCENSAGVHLEHPALVVRSDVVIPGGVDRYSYGIVYVRLHGGYVIGSAADRGRDNVLLGESGQGQQCNGYQRREKYNEAAHDISSWIAMGLLSGRGLIVPERDGGPPVDLSRALPFTPAVALDDSDTGLPPGAPSLEFLPRYRHLLADGHFRALAPNNDGSKGGQHVRSRIRPAHHNYGLFQIVAAIIEKLQGERCLDLAVLFGHICQAVNAGEVAPIFCGAGGGEQQNTEQGRDSGPKDSYRRHNLLLTSTGPRTSITCPDGRRGDSIPRGRSPPLAREFLAQTDLLRIAQTRRKNRHAL